MKYGVKGKFQAKLRPKMHRKIPDVLRSGGLNQLWSLPTKKGEVYGFDGRTVGFHDNPYLKLGFAKV